MTGDRKLVAGGVLGAALLVVATVLATLAVVEPESPAGKQGATAVAAAADGAGSNDPAIEDQALAEPEATTSSPAPGPTLQAADLTLTPKIVKKQCFGSAGCSVGIKVEVGYSGPALSEDETWEVIYEVTGDEDGPVIDSIELTGTQYLQNEVSVSTPSSKTKITIKVTDISLLG